MTARTYAPLIAGTGGITTEQLDSLPGSGTSFMGVSSVGKHSHLDAATARTNLGIGNRDEANGFVGIDNEGAIDAIVSVRQGTAAELNEIILRNGELAIEIEAGDPKGLRAGDGTTAGGVVIAVGRPIARIAQGVALGITTPTPYANLSVVAGRVYRYQFVIVSSVGAVSGIKLKLQSGIFTSLPNAGFFGAINKIQRIDNGVFTFAMALNNGELAPASAIDCLPLVTSGTILMEGVFSPAQTTDVFVEITEVSAGAGLVCLILEELR